MKINQEFRKLQQLASTVDGREKLKDAFSKTAGYHTFVIDPTTLEHRTGIHGEHPEEVRNTLLERLLRNHGLKHYERAEMTMASGKLARFEGFEFPIVMLTGSSHQDLGAIESLLLDNGIALPVAGLLCETGKLRSLLSRLVA
ncbi:MAG: hypothetical protein WCV82_03120 [Candidatus Paceibacterota bacterium]